MLELAHKLADSDAKFFGGWVLAGAEAHIHQPAEAMANQVLLAKERKSIIRVAGTATDGSSLTHCMQRIPAHRYIICRFTGIPIMKSWAIPRDCARMRSTCMSM